MSDGEGFISLALFKGTCRQLFATSSLSQELLKGEQREKRECVFLEEISVLSAEVCLWFSHFTQSVLFRLKLTGRKKTQPLCFPPCVPLPLCTVLPPFFVCLLCFGCS